MRLTLYHLESCPFCHRVRAAAARLGIDLDLVEIREHPEARELLFAKRGRGTVPVLGIPTEDGERLLGESTDIVAWLEAHAAQAVRA